MLLAASSFKSSDYRAMVEETADQTPTLERVVYVDTGDWADLIDAGRIPAGGRGRRAAGADPAR